MTQRKPNPKWPNVRPDVSTAEIIQRYVSGESSKTIATDLGCSARTVLMRLRAAGVQPRGQGKVKPLGPLHPSWVGDAVTYAPAHQRVRNARGRPSSCSVCGTSEPRMYHWANLTGKYSDPADYAPMCVPCHSRYDRTRRERAED